jgi:hypothetical protein
MTRDLRVMRTRAGLERRGADGGAGRLAGARRLHERAGRQASCCRRAARRHARRAAGLRGADERAIEARLAEDCWSARDCCDALDPVELGWAPRRRRTSGSP